MTPRRVRFTETARDPNVSTPGLRRLFMRKLNCHIYYTFDDDEVVVRALWGARRERGPMI